MADNFYTFGQIKPVASHGKQVIDAGNNHIADCINEDVARFIARAYNSHHELLEGAKAMHKAIDILFAERIRADEDFRCTKSVAWPLLVQGHQAIKNAERK